MKKLFYTLVLFSGIANAQIVNIPDANFKTKLIAIGVDTNNDSEIQQSEALVITQLNLQSANINDLTGIEAFSNLTFLYLYNNPLVSFTAPSLPNLNNLGIRSCQLTSLDISALTNLQNLDCKSNSLAGLNVSTLVNLNQLDCSNNLLTTLTISGDTALHDLNCSNNQLLSLNLTGVPNLTNLTCGENGLTTLNVSSLPLLAFLDCSHNPFLSTLDLAPVASTLNSLIIYYCQSLDINNCISPLVNLTGLNCLQNNLTSLDVSHMLNLQVLNCGTNPIPSLDLTANTNLFTLSCTNVPLTELDVSNMQYLGYLDCMNTQLTTIDVSNNMQFQTLLCGGPALQSIFMKNGTTENFQLSSSANLQYICGDDNQIANVQQVVNSSGGNPNTVVNSYCSFTPGGNYNTITGTVTFDANANGCDSNDVLQPNIKIGINDSTIAGASFTNTTGNYTFYTAAGSFDITPNVENPTWFNFTPESATIPFADSNDNIVTQNFCIAANGIHPDVEVVIAPIVMARPGFAATYLVVYKNKGNQILSGNVIFTYEDSALDFVSSTVAPSLQSTGLLTYGYTNLLPFESRSFYITLQVNTPTDTPPVNIGDQLEFTSTVNPIDADENPSDNTFQYNQTVVGSLDPNDITCLEGNLVSPTEIGNYLHYIINFENTGTADAENIVVRDVIDTTQFDVNSLQVLNSSASVTAKLTGNVAEFIFPSINLHSGGHGNILIKVKSKNNLVQGDSVNKKASIYFDYNAPIDTNIENTIFQALSNPDYETDASISVYPNPSKGNVNINCDNNIKSIQLFDVQGRLLQTNLVNENQTTIDISDKSKGVYFLKIISDKGIGVEKIVRE